MICVSCGVKMVFIIPESESSFSWSEFMFSVGSSTSGSEMAKMSGRLQVIRVKICSPSCRGIHKNIFSWVCHYIAMVNGISGLTGEVW